MKYASVLLAVSCLLSGVSAQSLGTKAGIDVRNSVLFGNPAGSQTYYASAELPWAAEPRRSRALVYTLEGLGALPGMVGCGSLYGVAAGVAFAVAWGGGRPPVAVICVALTSAALLPAVAAYGTIYVGDALGEHGSKGLAVGGAYAGAVVMEGLVLLGAAVKLPVIAAGAFYASLLAIPAGAVVGYNLRIPKKQVSGLLEQRLEPPGVTFTRVELADHSMSYGVRVQLAGLAF